MVIFQGADNTFWFWVSLLLTAATALAVWYWTIVGRDRAPQHQRRGQDTVERYGDIEEDRAPLPKFLIYTFVLTVLWGIGYALLTGWQGIGN